MDIGSKSFRNRYIFSALAIALSAVLYFSYTATESTKPRVSIITSVYKGDEFIEGFFEDIVQQTIFPHSELIVINANSPGNEEPIIRKYADKHSNIVYVKLDQDPGLYAVWNQAIKLAKADYITNANIDDRSAPEAIELQVQVLDENPDLDLVYTGYLVTQYPNESWAKNNYKWYCDPKEFSVMNMMECLPGPRPVWRKAIHEKNGYFDEAFTSSGDLEMWLRAVSNGSKFQKIPGYLTLFYVNPKGISTNKEKEKVQQRQAENQVIIQRYGHLWKEPKTEIVAE